MKSSTWLRGQRGHAGAALVALATLGVFLASLAAATPAAANGQKRVTCALPYVLGAPNFFCTGLHKVLFTTEGFTNNDSTITAMLEARDEQGNVVQALPVHSGDLVRMTSLLDLGSVKVTQKNNLFTVVAPRPVLHVVAIDNTTKEKAEAFCSSVPWVQVNQPQGAVVNLSESNVSHVEASIPLVDPAQLEILVDGVDVLSAMVPPVGNILQCTPSSPCSGTVQIGTEVVTISNLTIDTGSLTQYAANTIAFDISGLGCGGHLFNIHSGPRPGSTSRFVSPTCHSPNNVADIGLASVFGITLDKPEEGQAGLSFPVQVQGEACGGLPITALNINGASYDATAGQTPIAPCDNQTTPCSYKLPFDENVSSTNVPQDVSLGNVLLGTFDPGSNRVVAAAADEAGNRTFAQVVFGTGSTANPGVNATLELGGLGQNALIKALGTRVKQALKRTNEAVLQSSSFPIPNSFVIGLSVAAMEQQFTQRCVDPVNGVGKIFRDKIFEILQPTAPAPYNTGVVITVDPDCSVACDVPMWVTSIQIDPSTITCPLDFSVPHEMRVTINLPSVTFSFALNKDGGSGNSSAKSCTDEELGVCISRTIVNVTGDITLSGMNAKFTITENGILNNTEPTVVFFKGNAEPPNKPTVENQNMWNTGIECLGAVCAFFEVIFDAITFGVFDLDIIDVQVNTEAFKNAIGASEPDPVKVKEMKINPEKVENFNQTLAGDLSSVNISEHGLLAGLTGNFATLYVDPEVQVTPGALLTGNNLPAMPMTGMQGAAILISADALNQMFASMTLGGNLKTNVKDTGLTLGDLVKDECDTMESPAGTEVATAVLQGICHGIKLADCEGLTAADPALTAAKQGTCHATRGDNCSAIPVPAQLLLAAQERFYCSVTPNLNLNANQPVNIATRLDIPPRMMFPGAAGAAGTIDTTMRMNMLSVSLVVNRDNEDLTGVNIDDIPKCFGQGGAVTGACSLYAACLTLNFNFAMGLANSEACGTLPGFVNQFKSAQILIRDAGIVCGGTAIVADDGSVVNKSSTTEIIAEELPEQAQNAAPPICLEGMDLGGFVSCGQPTLMAVKGNPETNPAFQDYIGLTCQITAP